MRKSFLWAGLGMLSCLCGSVPAESPNKPWITIGDSGQVSCGQFIALYNDDPLGKTRAMTWQGDKYFDAKYVYMQWAYGFITGTNMAQANARNQINVDGTAVELWMKQTCESHPTSKLVDVMVTFTQTQLKGLAH